MVYQPLLKILTIFLVVSFGSNINGVIALPRVVSPLKSFTLFDEKQELSISPRERHLMKRRVGIQAETRVREKAEKKYTSFIASEKKKGVGWHTSVAAYKVKSEERTNTIAKKAYDKAVKKMEASLNKMGEHKIKERNAKSSKYQFVGVVDKREKNKVKWYARKKYRGTKWSLRLVHVDQAAIIKDLHTKGKADIFAKYSKGDKLIRTTEDGKKEIINTIPVKAEYSVRERSWKTLWNFSLKHFFTDSSGMYWRERRLRPGIYTDGESVFETTYHYGEGRNGIKQIQKLNQFLEDETVSIETKQKALMCIKKPKPDLVIES